MREKISESSRLSAMEIREAVRAVTIALKSVSKLFQNVSSALP